MTWKEFKDWVESQGVKDDEEFDPSTDESEMDDMEIYQLPGQYTKRIGYKQD